MPVKIGPFPPAAVSASQAAFATEDCALPDWRTAAHPHAQPAVRRAVPRSAPSVLQPTRLRVLPRTRQALPEHWNFLSLTQFFLFMTDRRLTITSVRREGTVRHKSPVDRVSVYAFSILNDLTRGRESEQKRPAEPIILLRPQV